LRPTELAVRSQIRALRLTSRRASDTRFRRIEAWSRSRPTALTVRRRSPGHRFFRRNLEPRAQRRTSRASAAESPRTFDSRTLRYRYSFHEATCGFSPEPKVVPESTRLEPQSKGAWATVFHDEMSRQIRVAKRISQARIKGGLSLRLNQYNLAHRAECGCYFGSVVRGPKQLSVRRTTSCRRSLATAPLRSPFISLWRMCSASDALSG
jgi:hypothetical protein